MAPITKENLKVVENLSKFCEIRHIAAVQLSTTVVDGKYLYQFKTGPSDQEKQDTASTFKTPFYSDDSEYVGKLRLCWMTLGETLKFHQQRLSNLSLNLRLLD
jgi:hypothetical protein